MAKLHFKTGAMGCGKSLDLIRAVYNYRERGMEVVVYKPRVDTREGYFDCKIKSRTGAEIKANWISEHDDVGTLLLNHDVSTIRAVFIDEAQFLSAEQVDGLQKICYNLDIPVICYGLKLDFKSHLFEGSKRLIELADDVQELIGICHCGARAKQNAKVVDGRMITYGDVVEIGGNELYVGVCNKCYFKGRVE